MHTIWPGRRAHQVKYETINNSDLDGMSLASFCQSCVHNPTFIVCLYSLRRACFQDILLRDAFSKENEDYWKACCILSQSITPFRREYQIGYPEVIQCIKIYKTRR